MQSGLELSNFRKSAVCNFRIKYGLANHIFKSEIGFQEKGFLNRVSRSEPHTPGNIKTKKILQQKDHKY